MSLSKRAQTVPVRWRDPFIGWRLMALGTCPFHGCAALIGTRSGALHSAVSDPARCLSDDMTRWTSTPTALFCGSLGKAEEPDVPHEEHRCASKPGPACGYYAYSHVQSTDVPPGGFALGGHVIVAVRPVGRTLRHEDGFRTQRIEVVALFTSRASVSLPALADAASALGVPLFTDAPDEATCDALGLDQGEAAIASERMNTTGWPDFAADLATLNAQLGQLQAMVSATSLTTSSLVLAMPVLALKRDRRTLFAQWVWRVATAVSVVTASCAFAFSAHGLTNLVALLLNLAFVGGCTLFLRWRLGIWW